MHASIQVYVSISYDINVCAFRLNTCLSFISHISEHLDLLPNGCRFVFEILVDYG